VIRAEADRSPDHSVFRTVTCMPRLRSVAAAALLALAPICASQAQEVPAYHVLEDCVATARKPPRKADAALECLRVEEAALERALEAVLASLRAELSAKELALLESSQAAWKASYAADTMLSLELATDSDGVTYTDAPYYFRTLAYRDRIVQLQRYLSMYEDMNQGRR
jgi:hypothetical protein